MKYKYHAIILHLGLLNESTILLLVTFTEYAFPFPPGIHGYYLNINKIIENETAEKATI